MIKEIIIKIRIYDKKNYIMIYTKKIIYDSTLTSFWDTCTPECFQNLNWPVFLLLDHLHQRKSSQQEHLYLL